MNAPSNPNNLLDGFSVHGGNGSYLDDASQELTPADFKKFSVEFNYDETDRGNPLTAELTEASQQYDAEAREQDRRRAVSYYQSKVGEMKSLIFAAALHGNPSPELVGQRIYVMAFMLGLSRFATQAELADFLKVTPARVSQVKREIADNFPVFMELLNDSDVIK